MPESSIPSFGQHIKAYRKALDLTQEELAERANCALESVRKIEQDRQRPSRQLAGILADQLEVPAEERDEFVRLARMRPAVKASLPVPSWQSGSGNFPVQLTSLIGREKEIDEVCHQLRETDTHLLTMTGPGGVGKTRLAIEVGRALLDDFEDGVFFLLLSSLRDPALVTTTLAKTLGLRETHGRLLTRQVHDYLQNKHALLILDNFEHVLGAAPFLASLLEAAPDLRILVTSRAVLHLYGEREYCVLPLDVPDLRRIPAVRDLAGFDSVHFFLERARAARADFQLTEANAASIAEICSRLDGIPLALELAAAHCKMLSPQMILDQIRRQPIELESEARNVQERHQTLRNTLTWSYDLLDADEQVMFRWLAVFSGTWNLKAAEAVCDIPGGSGRSVFQNISALLDKSLLQPVKGSDESPRFHMLSTIQAFAMELLEASSEQDALRLRHLQYYLDFARKVSPQLSGTRQGEFQQLLSLEYDNLRMAIQFAISQERGEDIVEICSLLQQFWYVYGQPGELQQWLNAVLLTKEKLPALARAQAHELMGYVQAFMFSDYGNARKSYEQALALWRQVGKIEKVAETLGQMGNVTLELGDYDYTRDLYEESMSISQKLDDQPGLVGIRECLGVLLMRQGELDQAGTLFQEGLAWWLAHKEPQHVAFATYYLGSIAMYRGEYKKARSLLEDARHLWESVRDMRGVSAALNALGAVILYEGDLDRAEDVLKQSLTLRWEFQDYNGIAWNLERLAHTAFERGEWERGALLWGSADGLHESQKSPLFPMEEERFRAPLARARERLGEEKWQSACTEGCMMPIDQVVAFALS